MTAQKKKKKRLEERVWLGPGAKAWLREDVAGVDISHQELKAIIAEAAKRSGSQRPPRARFLIGAAQLCAATLAALIAFVVTMRLTRSLPLGLTAIFVAVLAVVVIFNLNSMRSSAFARDVRAVLRERGYEVCMRCGYWLRGLDVDVERCPECGAERQRDGSRASAE